VPLRRPTGLKAYTDKGCGGVLDITETIINNTNYNLKIKI
jgi:predicted secreted acid phosphatase